MAEIGSSKNGLSIDPSLFS